MGWERCGTAKRTMLSSTALRGTTGAAGALAGGVDASNCSARWRCWAMRLTIWRALPKLRITRLPGMASIKLNRVGSPFLDALIKASRRVLPLRSGLRP